MQLLFVLTWPCYVRALYERVDDKVHKWVESRTAAGARGNVEAVRRKIGGWTLRLVFVPIELLLLVSIPGG